MAIVDSKDKKQEKDLEQAKKAKLKSVIQNDPDLILLENTLKSKDISMKLIMTQNGHLNYLYHPISKKFEQTTKENLGYLVNKYLSHKIGERIYEYKPSTLENLYKSLLNTSKIDDKNILKEGTLETIIGIKNGYLIYKNKQLIFESYVKGQPRKFFTTYIDREYKPELLKKPNKYMMDYFYNLMDENVNMTAYLIKSLSAILIPNNVLQKFFSLVGKGGNGKNVLANLIENVFGSENFMTMAPNDLERKDNVDTVSSKLINWTADLNSSLLKSTDMLKAISSGDTTAGRALYAKSNSIKMNTKIFINSNRQLSLTHNNEDGGIRRRIITIPFRKTYSNEERDSFNESELLSEHNLDFLFALMVQQSNVILREGVNKTFAMENAPLPVQEMYEEFLDNTNYLIEFMEEVKPLIKEELASDNFLGLVWKQRDGTVRVSFDNLYSLYLNYCRKNAFKSLHLVNFVNKLMDDEWFRKDKKPVQIPTLYSGEGGWEFNGEEGFGDLRRNHYDLEKTKREIVQGVASRHTGTFINSFLKQFID